MTGGADITGDSRQTTQECIGLYGPLIYATLSAVHMYWHPCAPVSIARLIWGLVPGDRTQVPRDIYMLLLIQMGFYTSAGMLPGKYVCSSSCCEHTGGFRNVVEMWY